MTEMHNIILKVEKVNKELLFCLAHGYICTKKQPCSLPDLWGLCPHDIPVSCLLLDHSPINSLEYIAAELGSPHLFTVLDPRKHKCLLLLAVDLPCLPLPNLLSLPLKVLLRIRVFPWNKKRSCGTGAAERWRSKKPGELYAAQVCAEFSSVLKSVSPGEEAFHLLKETLPPEGDSGLCKVSWEVWWDSC